MGAKEVNSLDRKRPSSIECEEAKLTAKKTNTLLPIIHPILNQKVYRLKLRWGAKAIIIKELSPKEFRIDPDALLDLGSQISGKIIECISTNPVNKLRVGEFSGRHRAQYSFASGYVYCNVFVPFK